MLRWKTLCAVLALGAVAATLPGEASAQQAPAATQATAAPAQRPVLRARDLITPQERQAYRQAMRAARNDPARQQQLRTQWRETLSQRAAARGGVLAESRMMKPGMKKAGKEANNERRPPAPPRAP